jgi:hypothetical protein
MRLAIAAAAPLLAAVALATLVIWRANAGPNSAAWWSPLAAIAALIASAWAILAAPSRALLALGIGSLVIASITLLLWWDAIRVLVESS